MSTMRTTTTTSRSSEGPSSVKTTTYETKSNYETEGITYRPVTQAKQTIITRAPIQPIGSSRSMSMRSSYGGGNFAPMASEAYGNITSTGVTNVKTARVQEKKDMQDLNERFASYIEKVRFLEAQNKKLADELERLKAKWGKETSAIKAMYQAELDEARRLLDESEKDKSGLDVKLNTMQEQMDELAEKNNDLTHQNSNLREKLEQQNQQLSDYEAEINLLRRRLESLENDKERDKKEIAKLQEALNRARIDLDNETLAHIDAENRRQTLEEEIEFLKNVHDQEMKELAALAYRDTTAENREFWKNEMGNALREIQSTYDEKLDGMRGELETYYNLKIQEFRTGATRQNMETVHAKEESKKLRAQVTDLRNKLADIEARCRNLEAENAALRRERDDMERSHEEECCRLNENIAKLQAEMESMLKELQDLIDTKLGLELEIAAYRKLLEGEENRIGMKQVVHNWVSGGQIETHEDSSLKVSQVVKGEMSAKTTYQRSAKGPVSISEITADGAVVTLENTSRKEENLSSYVIRRIIDGTEKINYTIPSGQMLRGNSKLKIFSQGKRPRGNNVDLELNNENWGIGANITTKLVNSDGDERATHVQKTTYA